MVRKPLAHKVLRNAAKRDHIKVKNNSPILARLIESGYLKLITPTQAKITSEGRKALKRWNKQEVRDKAEILRRHELGRQIIEQRAEPNSVDAIAEALGCSRYAVSYYLERGKSSTLSNEGREYAHRCDEIRKEARREAGRHTVYALSNEFRYSKRTIQTWLYGEIDVSNNNKESDWRTPDNIARFLSMTLNSRPEPLKTRF